MVFLCVLSLELYKAELSNNDDHNSSKLITVFCCREARMETRKPIPGTQTRFYPGLFGTARPVKTLSKREKHRQVVVKECRYDVAFLQGTLGKYLKFTTARLRKKSAIIRVI